MASIKDYDADFHVGVPFVKRLEGMCGILTNQLNEVPIYFVKNETIDQYNTSLCLKRNCTEEALGILDKARGKDILDLPPNLREMRNTKDIVNKMIELVQEKLEKCLDKRDTIACYVSGDDNICIGRHILVCPEKIKHENYQQFEDLLIFIILHELSHAFLSSGKEIQDISKHIIEESMCEAYAFTRFENTNNIVDFVTNPQRPPEYTSFKFWLDPKKEAISVNELVFHMASWRSNKDRVFIMSILRHFPWYFSDSYSILSEGLYDMISSGSLSGLAIVLLLFS